MCSRTHWADWAISASESVVTIWSTSSDGAVGKMTEEASDLGFKDHTNGDALTVKNIGCEDGFVGVADGVTKVENPAQPPFPLVLFDHSSLHLAATLDHGDDATRLQRQD